MADSSYLVEGLLEGGGAFEDTLFVPDIAVAEVLNAFYVQERVMKVIDDGRPYLDLLFAAIEAGSIEVLGCTREVMSDAFDMGARNKGTAYDFIFVALALKLEGDLKTRDRRQAEIMRAELERRQGGRPTPERPG